MKKETAKKTKKLINNDEDEAPIAVKTAEQIEKEFKEHSVAEFFKKNKQMLGLFGKVRTLTTVVHEYVTNSLDACEEAAILPDIEVKIKQLGEEHLEVTVTDNGPGLTQESVGKALGQLLAGTKFHRLVQSRGQQGIGACVKSDTLVPLADGRILTIKEIVDNDLVGEEAISLDLNSLKLVSGKISKYWKVKNPLFISLKTQKGRKILLTPENPVLSIIDGRIEWIRADEVELGTKIAVPNKLPAFESSNKRTIELFDENSIQIDEPELINKIKEKLLKKFSSITGIAKRFGLKKDAARNWFTRKMKNNNPRGRPALKMLKEMAKEAEINQNELFESIERIGRNGTYSKIPKFIDKETAWVAGLIAGDGHLSSEKDDKWGVNISLAAGSEKIADKYKQIIEQKFGLKTQKYYNEKKHYYTIQCSSKILSEILEYFGITRGKKFDCFKLSNNLFSQDENIIAAYLNGLFDAEGSTSAEKRTISLTLYNKPALEQVFYALLRIGIHANINKSGKENRLTITGKENIYLFLQKIGFSDKLKLDKIVKIINNTKKENTQFDTIPGINKKIIEIAKKNNIALTNLPTASYSTIHNNNISKKSLMQAIQVLSLSNFEEKQFFEKLANADVSWLEIVEKRIERNEEEFVYDLEIEKHHNFIAGGIICHNSGATMLSQTTTGKAVKVITGTAKGKPISLEMTIDTKNNLPKITDLKQIDKNFRGTAICAQFKDVVYRESEQGSLEYIRRTAIANPHAQITFIDPSGNKTVFKRTSKDIPKPPEEVKPHPKGVTVDDLLTFSKTTDARKISSFLKSSFDRMGDKAIEEIEKKVSFDLNKDPSKLNWNEAEEIVKLFKGMSFIAPRTDALRPIGEARIEKSLKSIVQPEFLNVITRKPTIYRGGFPFQVEVAVAFGGNAGRPTAEQIQEGQTGRKIEVMRFANRSPLLFDGGGCAITKAVQSVEWKRYGIKDIENAPLTVLVNFISVHVPYTSAGKQAIADEDEVLEELRLALMDSGRRVSRYIIGQRKLQEKQMKREIFLKYIPEIALALSKLTEEKEQVLVKKLEKIVLEKLKLDEQKEAAGEEVVEEEIEEEEDAGGEE